MKGRIWMWLLRLAAGALFAAAAANVGTTTIAWFYQPRHPEAKD